MKNITVYELALLLEDGEPVVIQNGFNFYDIDKETLIEGNYQFKNNTVISFRNSTNYNKILIEC